MTDIAPETEGGGNARPYSVSELAFALKRTLEDAYGFVRLRGELSKVTHHSNGHVYLTIKDERAASIIAGRLGDFFQRGHGPGVVAPRHREVPVDPATKL